MTNDYKKLQKNYDEMAAGYEETVKVAKYAIPEWLQRQFPQSLRKGKPLCLDLACASGNLGQLLFDFIPTAEIYGFDLSPKMIAEARKKKIYKELNVHNLDLPLESFNLPKFDFVMAIGFMEFLNNLPDFLTRVASVMKAGATFCCTFQEFEEGNKEKPRTTNSSGLFNHQAFSEAEVIKMLKEHSLKVEGIEKVTAYISPSSGFHCPYLLVKALKQ